MGEVHDLDIATGVIVGLTSSGLAVLLFLLGASYSLWPILFAGYIVGSTGIIALGIAILRPLIGLLRL